MRALATGAVIVAALVALAPGRAASQTDTTLHITQFMSPAERDSTGIATLSAEQLAALDAWLARYTAATAMQIAQHTPPQAITIRRPSVRNGFRVVRINDNGSSVVLGDGTVWKIDPADRPTTDTWLVGDFVLVRRDPAPVRSGQETFDYTLSNGRDRRDPPRARLVGRVVGGQP